MTLKEARELIGISRRALDLEAGVPEGTVWEIEGGKNQRPSHQTVTFIVRALRRLGLPGADAEQLFPVAVPESKDDLGAKAS